MKRFSKTITMFTLCAALLAGLVGCGSDEANISAVINNQEVDLAVDGVDIVATCSGGVLPPTTTGIPGVSGLSVQITIRFINGNILDILQFTILDMNAVQVGIPYPINQSLIVTKLLLNGVEQFVLPGQSTIQFDEANLAGKFRGQFQVNSPTTTMIGTFEDDVQVAC